MYDQSGPHRKIFKGLFASESSICVSLAQMFLGYLCPFCVKCKSLLKKKIPH